MTHRKPTCSRSRRFTDNPFRALFLRRAGEAKPITLTPEQMQAKVGVYVNTKDPDELMRWTIKDGKLQVGSIGDDRIFDIKPISENQFRLLVRPVDFAFLPVQSGAPSQFTSKHEDGEVDTYSEVPAFAPSATQLAEYAGIYSSPEIDPLYELKIESGADGKATLVLYRLKNGPDTLRPVTRDFFTADLGRVRFTRDSKDVITGFLLSTGRANDLRFERGRPAIPAR
jgi:hypothetical protein